MFDLNCSGVSAKKTPLALTLAPEAEKLNGKFVKNFYRYVRRHAHGPGGGAAVSRHDAAGRGGGKAARGGAAGRSVSASRDDGGGRAGEPCQRGPCQGTVCDTGYEHRGAGVLGRVRGGRRDGVPLRREAGAWRLGRCCPSRRYGLADRYRVWWPATGRCGCPWRSRWHAGVQRWLCPRGYSLDVRDVRRVCPGAFLLLEDCDGENALPAFDDIGHGALAADSALQYAAEPAAAVEEAVRAWKQWVTVV